MARSRSVIASNRIVQLLREQGALSQAEIARRTGLGKSTVSRVVDELHRASVVIDAGPNLRPARRAGGRPATALTLNPDNGTCIGIQIGPRSIRAVLADVSHAVLATEMVQLNLDYTPEQGIDAARHLIGRVQETARTEPERLLGIGIAVPSPVHPETGRVFRSSMIGTWAGIRIARLFEQHLGCPVVADNEANCAALAELTWGAARGYSNVIYYKIDLGLGGAVIANGQLVRGIAGGAGEFGHTIYDPNGPLCRCGNRGCYELYASSAAMLKLLQPTYGVDFTVPQMINAAVAGDIGCRRVIADAGTIAGRCLATICNAFNPELIVVGGAMTNAGELLLEPLREAVARDVLIQLDGTGAMGPMTAMTIGTLDENASALGAMGLALRQLGGSEPSHRQGEQPQQK